MALSAVASVVLVTKKSNKFVLLVTFHYEFMCYLLLFYSLNIFLLLVTN